jgi:hypothetical protein
MTRAICAAVAIALGLTVPASAQTTPGHIEVAIGAAWFGGVSMAPLSITETQADGTPRTVFDLSRQLTSAAGLDARIAVRLSPRWNVEATGSYARPQLQLLPSNDVEGAAPVTAAERLQEFTVGGAASWFFVRRNPQSRTMPFVAGGVAYARQLHQTSTLADSGPLVEAGGGVDELLWSHAGRLKAIGVRADVRARVRPKALAVDGRAHVTPVAAASLVLRF